MCGCEQGLCKGGCACGCNHTWPPSWHDVTKLLVRERENNRHYVNRVNELWEELEALKSQPAPECRHDLRTQRLDAWLNRVNTTARMKCDHGTELAYLCDACDDETYGE